MKTIMLAANMKPRKRRKKPPRRRRRRCSGGLTGAVISMFSDPSRPPVLSARGTRGNPSEDYGNKTLVPAENRRSCQSGKIDMPDSKRGAGDPFGEIAVDGIDERDAYALAPGIGHEMLFVIGVGEKADLDQYGRDVRGLQHAKAGRPHFMRMQVAREFADD